MASRFPAPFQGAIPILSLPGMLSPANIRQPSGLSRWRANEISGNFDYEGDSPWPRLLRDKGDLNKNEKSPPDLSVRQGQIGGWEFAMLSFPCWHSARTLSGAASFPTLFSTASGVFGLVAGPSSVLRALNFE